MAQEDAPVAEAVETDYPEDVQAPSAGRRISPKVLALAGIVVLAGAAYALRAPLGSIIASNKATDTTAVASDSVQLLTTEADPQLNDRGMADTQFVITPEMLERAAGGRQPVITMRPEPQPPNPQARAPQARTQSSTASSSRSMPIPEEPPEFPDFKTPATPPGGSGTAATSSTAGDSRVSHEPPARTVGRIAAGARLSLKSASQVCTDRTQQGARFTAIVQQDVVGSSGATIPSGTPVTFVVDRLKRAQNAGETSEFSVAPESIELAGERYPISATVDAVTIKQKSRSLLGALAGAAAAAAAAKAAGGDTKQTVATGIAGGAAGAVIGNQIRGGDGCIEKSGSIRITLGSDLTLRGM